MKKFGIIAGLVLIALAALFFWGLSATSPDNAPTDVRTIDVTPQP